MKTQELKLMIATLCLAPLALAGPTNHLDTRQKIHPTNPPFIADPNLWIIDPVEMIMAGSQNGSPPDSPTQRIDPNVSTSPYSGVCELTLGGAALCSGVPISRFHILTAGHCVDFNADGANDVGTNIVIRFNFDGDGSTIIGPGAIASVDVNPDYTGFNNPSVNDDMTIITLNQPLPSFIPIYPIFTGQLNNDQLITAVGYGRSGFGDVGDNIGANQNIKRVGQNLAEMFFNNDEGGSTVEVFEYDFDGATGATNCFGGGSLGNDIETAVAPGDSGGPSFIQVGNTLFTWGINTFGGSCIGPTPLFGSLGGGIVVNGYLPWFAGFVPPSPFDLLLPADNADGVELAPLFDWSTPSFAGAYTLTIATDSDLNNVVFEQAGILPSQFQAPSGVLTGSTSYFWDVVAINPNGSTASDSGPFTFTTVPTGDLNADGSVNGVDLAILLTVWGTDGQGSGADLNGDGVVNGADLAALLAAWTG